MTQRLVVVGAGGFGRETLDVVDAINEAAGNPVFDVVGVVDDAPSELNLKRLAARGTAYLGTVEEWLAGGAEAEYVVAVGSPSARQALVDRFDERGLRAATLVHPRAGIGSVTMIGAGTVICAGVQISTNVQLGRHVHLNPSVTVGHDAVLDDYVSVNPAATISGQCRIGEGVRLGAACAVLQGLTVGARAVVGASACVVHDVADADTVVGVPAKPIRK